MDARSFAAARGLALLLPLALIAGALGSQFVGGLYPCEMCHWQRWPHYTAIALASLAFAVPSAAARKTMVALAAFAILTSGAIGVFHAGVEYHWWEGITTCATTTTGQGGTPAEMLARIMNAPIVRCDVAQWRLFGVSLAGYNALFSLVGGGMITAMLVRKRRV
ncbi:MAG: disulfide bond formation protein B [Sphingomonas sp.]